MRAIPTETVCRHRLRTPGPTALALLAVMAGGVFAGIIGPQLVTHTMNLSPPYLFAATYLAQAVVAVLFGFCLAWGSPTSANFRRAEGGRPLAVIAPQPRFITAVMRIVSYLPMHFLMTAAPLAMHPCGLSQEDAILVLACHGRNVALCLSFFPRLLAVAALAWIGAKRHVPLNRGGL